MCPRCGMQTYDGYEHLTQQMCIEALKVKAGRLKKTEHEKEENPVVRPAPTPAHHPGRLSELELLRITRKGTVEDIPKLINEINQIKALWQEDVKKGIAAQQQGHQIAQAFHAAKSQYESIMKAMTFDAGGELTIDFTKERQWPEGASIEVTRHPGPDGKTIAKLTYSIRGKILIATSMPKVQESPRGRRK